MNKIIFLFLFITLFACSDEYGNKVKGGNLTVYFVNEKDQSLASDLAVFWKNNDLLIEVPQDLQILRKGDGYTVNIIAREPNKIKNMTFEERKALIDLQAMIRDSVFKEKNVDLIICDDQFKPILNINK